MTEKLLSLLAFLYGENISARLLERTQQLLNKYHPRIKPQINGLTEHDSILITYGDQVQRANELPLQTLKAFCDSYLSGVINGIHILPFYLWTSDDGFSVVDYRQIDPALGSWNDVSSMQNFRLMCDGVINHISSQSEWFKKFLEDDPYYKHYFITIEGQPDLSQVVRPRALPLLTSFTTPSGKKKVWTTFSSDQIDLNYKNPEVLLEILDILLLYIEHGVTFIRLDAIAYLWKEIGTTSIHLPQTHAVIQFLRAAINEVAPHVPLITETNVPHSENISYFGDGTNEAQLVYNFALPPLTMHAFHTGDARTLSAWAKTLTLPSDKTTFFNFLASHDGIGLNPVRGILSDADIDSLVKKVIEHGGLISYKHNSDGTQSPYEMNINYFDALSSPKDREPLELQIMRFITAQSIMLSLIGMPGIYFHSLFGSRGWMEGVKQTGRNRTINRERLQVDELHDQLSDSDSLRSKVFARLSQLLKTRSSSPAFHPYGIQKIIDLHPSVFAVERTSPDGNEAVLCLHNVSQRSASFSTKNGSDIILSPYEVLWLKSK